MSASSVVIYDKGFSAVAHFVQTDTPAFTLQTYVTEMQVLDAGIPGPQGAPGSASPLAIVAGEDLIAGLPVTISRSTGKAIKSDSSWKPTSFVAGLVSTGVGVGFVADIKTDRLTLSDWTAITATVSLQVGQLYFLRVGGGLTTTPPSSPNCITVIGEALDSTTLIIEPGLPFQL